MGLNANPTAAGDGDALAFFADLGDFFAELGDLDAVVGDFAVGNSGAGDASTTSFSTSSTSISAASSATSESTASATSARAALVCGVTAGDFFADLGDFADDFVGVAFFAGDLATGTGDASFAAAASFSAKTSASTAFATSALDALVCGVAARDFFADLGNFTGDFAGVGSFAGVAAFVGMGSFTGVAALAGVGSFAGDFAFLADFGGLATGDAPFETISSPFLSPNGDFGPESFDPGDAIDFITPSTAPVSFATSSYRNTMRSDSAEGNTTSSPSESSTPAASTDTPFSITGFVLLMLVNRTCVEQGGGLET